MFEKLRAWLYGTTVKEVKNYDETKNLDTEKDTQTKIRNAIEFLDNNKDKDCTIKILVPKQVKQIPYGDISFLEQVKMDISSKVISLVANKHLYNNTDTWVKIYDELLVHVNKVLESVGVENPTALSNDILDAVRKVAQEEAKKLSDKDLKDLTSNLNEPTTSEILKEAAIKTMPEESCTCVLPDEKGQKQKELVDVIQKIVEQEVKKLPDCDLQPTHSCMCRVIGPGTFPPGDPDGSKARTELDKILSTPMGTKIGSPSYGAPIISNIAAEASAGTAFDMGAASVTSGIVDAVGHYSEKEQFNPIHMKLAEPLLPSTVWTPTPKLGMVTEETVVDTEDNSCETLGARELKNTVSVVEDDEVVEKHLCIYPTDCQQNTPKLTPFVDTFAPGYTPVNTPAPVTPIPARLYTPPVVVSSTPALAPVTVPSSVEETVEDEPVRVSNARELKNTSTVIEEEVIYDE